jgi:MFS transporter, CP family, cyanate transporter
VSLTLPVVLPLLGNRWTWSFAFWGVLVLLSALTVTWLSRGLPDSAGNPHGRWWPDWEKSETWRLGLLMGGSTLAYFGANAFIPDFLQTTGRSRLIGECLTILNGSQLPASLIGVLAGAALAGRRQPLMIFAAAIFLGVGALLMKPDWAVLLGAGILGFCLALLLTLTLALPPLLAQPGDVHRLSGGMFALAYVYSFAAQIGTGKFWDATHFAATAMLPVALGALTALLAVAGLPPTVANFDDTEQLPHRPAL